MDPSENKTPGSRRPRVQAAVCSPCGPEQRSQSGMSDASKTLPMPMPTMEIRIVRVLMPNRLVPMPMGMRLYYRHVMSVLMMFVVNVAMLMFQNVVLMFMLMPFGKMQPKTNAHK